MMKFFTLKILNIFDYFYQKKFINFLKKKGINNFNVLIDIGAHKGESINLFANNFLTNKFWSGITFIPTNKPRPLTSLITLGKSDCN